MNQEKIKVLVSAYACEPHKGSEPGVGWNWAKQIAKFAEVWVITRANNREVIEEELQTNPVSNLHFIYYDVPRWLSFWKKKTKGLYLYYFSWQVGAFRLAKSINKQKNFDVVHHITFGNIWLPTFMSFLNIPFIWGPVGGGDTVPKIFRNRYSIKSKIQELVRDIILKLLKLNLLFIHTVKRPGVIITRTEETTKQIPKIYSNKIVKMIETGIQPENLPVNSNNIKKENIQIISVGRLIHWKGFDLGLMAFAKAFKISKNLRLTIIGDGPDKKRLLKICQSENIIRNILFTGSLEHHNALRLILQSDILLQPSLKEGGSWVLFEAMLSGLPIICLDIAGPSEIVTAECGFKIKPVTPEQTINDLAEALLRLAKDPDLRQKMGEASRKRVMAHYTWEKKGESVRKVYEDLLGINIAVNS